jgi:hypothetical protein
MKLKTVNPNGENVVVSNLIIVNFLFLKIVKIELKNEDHMFSFSKRCHDCPKKKILILLTSHINIEWIKTSLFDMDVFYKKFFYKKFGSFFGVLVAVQMTRKKALKAV